MASCWTCGTYVSGYHYTCSACESLAELKSLRKGVQNLAERGESHTKEISERISDIAEVQQKGFMALKETLSAGLSEIASAIEWGFGEIGWQIQQQTNILQSIDQTLKTPGETQANEWRKMAEELRRRGVLHESEDFYLKALDLNRLDYRIYVGLAETYLQGNQFDKAKTVLERSLPHAPKREIDYKSYSFRLIGHIYACEEDYSHAVSILHSSVELSPHYVEGNYDYAQYCARVRNLEQCTLSLQKAILAKPIYWYLAQQERNFDPCRSEIRELLSSVSRAASHRAENAISKAESALKEADKLASKVILGLIKSRDAAFLSLVSQTVDDVGEQLNLAQNKVISGDYIAFLEAERIANDSYALGNSLVAKVHEERLHYAASRSAKVRRAWATVPESIGISLGCGFFGWLLLGVGGCGRRIFSITSTGGSLEAMDIRPLLSFIHEGVTGLVLGVIGGAIYGIYKFTNELD